tara:strand:- start:250 stop:423 length:174 start_codon:yes stop_codon:yes gene_type:complete
MHSPAWVEDPSTPLRFAQERTHETHRLRTLLRPILSGNENQAKLLQLFFSFKKTVSS